MKALRVHTLNDLGHWEPGERILVTGASGAACCRSCLLAGDGAGWY